MLDALVEVPANRGIRHARVTRRRHLKDLVRARMARTGESYSTARAHVAKRARAEVRGNPTVIVPVTDMERATEFYSAGLGLPVRSSSPTWTIVGDDDETIALEPGGSAGADVGIGIKVVDLPAVLTSVLAAGGQVESHHDAVARVADPDGNIVRLMAVVSR
jgi:predicted enzyme related to lactoylglutathione lyase